MNYHNSSVCSDNALTLKTSVLESLYSGQFISSTQLTKPNYVIIPLPK